MKRPKKNWRTVTRMVPVDTTTKDYEFYEGLVRQALREFRGRSTQKKMSERLGVSLGRWHKWESGEKAFMWSDLRKVADRFELNLNPPIEALSRPGFSLRNSGGEFIKTVLTKYDGPAPREAAATLGISMAKFHRIVGSKNDVSLALVFQCLGEFSSTLPFFVGSIVSNFSRLDSLRRAQYVSNEANFPWLSAIEAYLETEEYRIQKTHNHARIADRLGLTVEDVRFGVALLLQGAVIRKHGAKFDLVVKRVDLETSISDSARFAQYWTQISQSRHETFDSVPAPRRGWSSRVFPVSDEAQLEIRELQIEYLRKMAQAIARDRKRKKTRVQVFIHHYFDHHEFRNLKLKSSIAGK